MTAPTTSARTRGTFELEGNVVEHTGSFYKVRSMLAGRPIFVLCTLAGRMRGGQRVVLGDRVAIEVTPYDLTRGRIVGER